jgi:hypothetical protein
MAAPQDPHSTRANKNSARCEPIKKLYYNNIFVLYEHVSVIDVGWPEWNRPHASQVAGRKAGPTQKPGFEEEAGLYVGDVGLR